MATRVDTTPAAKSRSSAVAVDLAATAVDRRGGDTGATELLCEAIGSVPSPAEHHRRSELAHHLGRALWSVGALDTPVHVTGGAHIRPGGSDLVAKWVMLHGSRQLADGAVERRREQQHLSCAIRLFDDPLHGRQKPHVRHSVGLVDHDVVDVAERQRAHGDQVLEPAGAGNDEVDAGVERLALGAVPDAAVQRDNPASAVAGKGCDGFGDLLGQRRGGASTSAVGRRRRAEAKFSTKGNPKARVLPEPVGARPDTSRPVSMSGITAAWMGVGSRIPARRRRATKSSGTPSAWNPETDIFTYFLSSSRKRQPTHGSLHASDLTGRRGTYVTVRSSRPHSTTAPAPAALGTSRRTRGRSVASAGRLAGLGCRWEQSGLAGVGGPFRTAGRREPTGDGDRCRRALPAEGVGEQIDEGVDRHGIVVGVIGDELLPPVGAAEEASPTRLRPMISARAIWLICDMRT